MVDTSKAVAIITYLDSAQTSAEGETLRLYDFLHVGDDIELGREGVVTIAYFNPCREEDIRSGGVEVGVTESNLKGAATRLGRVLSCRYNEAVRPGDDHWTLRADRSGPYDAKRWFEVTIKSPTPVFAWAPPSEEPARFELALVDSENPETMWSTDAVRPNLGYPSDAPRLQPGLPYRATVSYSGGESLTAVFSVDPDMGVSNHAVNNIVLLTPQSAA
ncbi:MAG: hypothetical protein R3360_07635, partial [Alphaproteobacteria bacterium]|nr:hypothetical protein [Alphaproteobacteria bacterium]